MSDEVKRAVAWATATTVMVAATIVLLIVICLRVSANDRAKVVRDQQVRLACIAHRGTPVNGNSCMIIGGAS